MNFLAVKNNLYRTLRASRLDGAIPILETFFADYAREVSYQKQNTEWEMAVRERAGCVDSQRELDEIRVVHAVAHAVRKLVTLRHDGHRVTGTLFLLTDGKENPHG